MAGKIGIIVQARMSSSRFPGKSMKKIGREPLIFYVLHRLQLTGLPVVVCTSSRPSDDMLCDFLDNQGVPFHRGSLENVLQRYKETAEGSGIENIVRVTGDNPLVDIDYLMDSLSLFEKFEYVDGIYPKGLIKGTGFEFVTLSELKSIPSIEKEHQEHVTKWLRENLASSEKRTQLKPNHINTYRNDLVLTCDYREDLQLLQKIFEHFNFRYDMKIEDIISFIENYPALKTMNFHLH